MVDTPEVGIAQGGDPAEEPGGPVPSQPDSGKESGSQAQEERFYQSQYDKLKAQVDEHGGLESLLENESLLQSLVADERVQAALAKIEEPAKPEAQLTPEQKAAEEYLAKIVERILEEKLKPLKQAEEIRLQKESAITVRDNLVRLEKEFEVNLADPSTKPVRETMQRFLEEGIKSGEIPPEANLFPSYRLIRRLYLDAITESEDALEKVAERIVGRKVAKAKAMATATPTTPPSAEGMPVIDSVKAAFEFAKKKHGW